MVFYEDLCEILCSNFQSVNQIGDVWLKSCVDCNFANTESFEEIDTTFLNQDFIDRSMEQLYEVIAHRNSSDQKKVDLVDVFAKSDVHPQKLVSVFWYLIEKIKDPESEIRDIFSGFYAACAFLEMCHLDGAKVSEFYQETIYQRCLKLFRDLGVVVKLGNGEAKAKKPTKKDASLADATVADKEENGLLRIDQVEAEKCLRKVSASLFRFLYISRIFLSEESLLETVEIAEELGKIDLKRGARNVRLTDVSMFHTLNKWHDRAIAIVNIVADRSFNIGLKIVYGRLVRPRLALLSFSVEGGKAEKVPIERFYWADLMTAFIASRVENGVSDYEMSLIYKVVIQVYVQCPDRQDYRNGVCQILCKILECLDYEHQYDFIQSMHYFANMKSSGVKQVSVELATRLLQVIDFDKPEPAPIKSTEQLEAEEEDRTLANQASDSEEENEGDEDDDEESEPGSLLGRHSSDEEENSDGEDKNKKKKMSKSKKKEKPCEKEKVQKKKRPERKVMERKDPRHVLFNILLTALLDKNPAIRFRAVGHFSKCIENQTYCDNFVDAVGKLADAFDEKFKIGIDDEDGEGETNKQSKTAQDQILRKFTVVKRMNEGRAMLEGDILFVLVERLLADVKPAVRKASCQIGRMYLTKCKDENKFRTVIGILENLCRDNTVAVRKQAALTINELMQRNEVAFKDVMSETWLSSLMPLLEDKEADVQATIKELIMNVITPLVESPNELTWELLKVIEESSMRRQYFMATLSEGAKEKMIKPSAMRAMRQYLENVCADSPSAWMVFSQMSVHFQENLKFAIDAWFNIDCNKYNPTLKYVIHVVIGNLKHVDEADRKKLTKSMKSTLAAFEIHPNHVQDVYMCMAKLMDGLGDEAKGTEELNTFAKELVDSCLEIIIKSNSIFEESEQKWANRAKDTEERLVAALHVCTEALQFSPSVTKFCGRFANALSYIVAFRERDDSKHNGDTQLSKVSDRLGSQHMESQFAFSQPLDCTQIQKLRIPFKTRVRAACVLPLASMCLSDEKMGKIISMFQKQLQENPAHEIRSNIVVAIADICEGQNREKYALMLAGCLCDPSVIIRRQAINIITRLITNQALLFHGEVMVRLMLSTLDENQEVRDDAKICLSEVLKANMKGLFKDHFVEYMLYFTQATRVKLNLPVAKDHQPEEQSSILRGGRPLPFAARIAVYNFMIDSLEDKERFEVKRKICLEIFNPVSNGEYDIHNECVVALVNDALLIMASEEMMVHGELGKPSSEEDQMAVEDVPEEIMGAAQNFLQGAYLRECLDVIVPSVLNMRDYVKEHHPAFLRKCILAIRMICNEHKDHIGLILADNKQLQAEMAYEMKRVQERVAEANRILDEQLKKLVDHQKKLQQRIQNGEVEEPMNVEGNADEPIADAAFSTPKKDQRVISPHTMRKLRRSLAAIVSDNHLNLNPSELGLNETVDENGGMGANKRLVLDGGQMEPAIKEEMPDDVEEAAELSEGTEEKTAMEPSTSTAKQMDVVERENDQENGQVNLDVDAEADSDELSTKENKSVAQSEIVQISPSRNRPELRRSAENCEESQRRKSREKPQSEEKVSPVWKKPRISQAPALNVTIRRSKRLSIKETVTATAPRPSDERQKTPEQTFLDDEMCSDGPRLCSTPKPNAPKFELTFDLNMSMINESVRQRGSKKHSGLDNLAEENE